MEVSKEFITFRCANSLVTGGPESSGQHSGIGLENMSKRLNLLYPGRHELKIDSTDSVFNVLVKIALQKA